MGVLSKTEIRKLLDEKILIIESLLPDQPFDPEKQITEESIDLRLGNTGLRYKGSITQIDTLFEKDIDCCFEPVEILPNGYELLPGKVLFAHTLELICLATRNYVGKIYGRSTFARYGLSVHCVQPKLSAGSSSVFPLQLINHNDFPIIVYPSSYVAQLMIETTSGPASPYDGKYDAEIKLSPPRISPRELEPIKDVATVKMVKATAAEQTENVKRIESLIKDFAKKEQERAALEQQKGEAQSKPKPSRKKMGVLRYMLGAASGAFFGIAGNLLASSEVNYWKTLSMCFSVMIGFMFLALAFSVRLYD